jgi:putative sterol carrier protein
MGVRFLSPEWAEAVSTALNSHSGFQAAIGSAELGIQFHVTGDSDIDYYLRTSGGNATLALGALDDADVTVTNTYDVAASISKGELNTQTAFMTGKLKVAGNLAKLMMHQSAITQWAAAVKDIEVDY